MKSSTLRFFIMGGLGCIALLTSPAFAQQEVDNAPSTPSWRDLIESSGPIPLENVGGERIENEASLALIQAREAAALDNLQDGAEIIIEPENQMTQEELEAMIRKEAYDAALTGLFPLEPDQIRDLLKYYDQTTEAVENPPYDLPQPEVAVKNISLDPGVLPPTINVAVGHVTTLNILDITGAPWPVQDVSWAGDFEVVEPQEGGHMIRITPMAEFANGNLSIRLLTLKTPLTFSLRTSRDKVHYRLDARVPEYGPFAEPGLISGGKELVAGSPVMTAVLDGIPPGDFTRLQVSGTDGRTTAYKSGGLLYVRTPLSLLSPSWQSSVASADGMNVYALNDTPVVLLSDNGEFTRATISAKEDLANE